MPLPTTIPLNGHDHQNKKGDLWFILPPCLVIIAIYGTHRVVGKSSGTSLENLGFSN